MILAFNSGSGNGRFGLGQIESDASEVAGNKAGKNLQFEGF